VLLKFYFLFKGIAMKKEFPSPIIMKHPSGLIKEVSSLNTFLLALFFGPFFYIYWGMWKNIIKLLLFLFVLFLFIMAQPSSNFTIFLAVMQPVYYIWLAYNAYDERCTILYNRGFRDFDYLGRPIER